MMMSIGEKIRSLREDNDYSQAYVGKLLQKSNIEYATQYTFPDLLGENGGRLRFDFAIFDDDGNIDFLIEYQGK